MRTRKRCTKSQQKGENSQTSSNFCDSKRRRLSNSQKKEMNESEWEPYDEQLLTLLDMVRDRREVSMGNDYNDDFYHNFAARLSASVGDAITAHDIADRFRHFRSIFKSYQVNPGSYRHPRIENAQYNDLLQRCFGQEKKAVRIPRNLGNGQNLGNQRSPSCSSSSSTARTVVQAPTYPIAPDPKIALQFELARALAHLRSQHASRLSTSKLTLFSSYLEQNQLASQVFLLTEGHEERLRFIDELDLTGYAHNPNASSVRNPNE